jgi:hypothetical protein
VLAQFVQWRLIPFVVPRRLSTMPFSGIVVEQRIYLSLLPDADASVPISSVRASRRVLAYIVEAVARLSATMLSPPPSCRRPWPTFRLQSHRAEATLNDLFPRHTRRNAVSTYCLHERREQLTSPPPCPAFEFPFIMFLCHPLVRFCSVAFCFRSAES